VRDTDVPFFPSYRLHEYRQLQSNLPTRRYFDERSDTPSPHYSLRRPRVRDDTRCISRDSVKFTPATIFTIFLRLTDSSCERHRYFCEKMLSRSRSHSVNADKFCTLKHVVGNAFVRTSPSLFVPIRPVYGLVHAPKVRYSNTLVQRAWQDERTSRLVCVVLLDDFCRYFDERKPFVVRWVAGQAQVNTNAMRRRYK